MKVWWVKNRKGKPFSVRRFKKYGMWSDFDGTCPETLRNVIGTFRFSSDSR